MICRPIKDSDYRTACKWWDVHGWPCMPKSVLPDTGSIVEDHCLGYLFLSNGGLCMIEYVVGNPERNGIEIVRSINMLLKDLLAKAELNGCTMVFSSVKNKSLIRMMERVGFSITDQGVTNLLYI